MDIYEAYKKSRLDRLALERENAKLKKLLEANDQGLYTPAEKAENLKKINQLTHQVNTLTKERDKYKSYFQNQSKISANLEHELFNVKIESKEEIERLSEEVKHYISLNNALQKRLDFLLQSGGSANEELTAKIAALTEELAKEISKNNTDGTNSSLPTSKTPIGKKKVIPNSRIKSGKKRGGQVGHVKHSLSPLSYDEITEFEDHTLSSCPDCNSSSLIFLEKRDKDVIDYETIVTKKRHSFYIYECSCCGHLVHSKIPLELKEPVQYGPNIQALSLALSNIGFVSVNRTKKLIDGLFGNDISLSEGYICKLQKRASSNLSSFVDDVRYSCLNSSLLHWDDTVIFINTEQACMRFYGNEHLALFKAHEKKNRIGIDNDGILGALGPNTTVVHDHVTMNYNDDFSFRNAECIQHLNRDIQKIIDNTSHSWAIQLKSLISETIHERNLLCDVGVKSFQNREVKSFMKEVDKLLKLAEEESKESSCRYFEVDESRLIRRIRKYKESHFLWVYDFSVPPTNNLAERSLRSSKVKQKVSGQFLSVKTAEYFANIRTYLETCSRNDINTFDALFRLTSGNPYTLSEVLVGE